MNCPKDKRCCWDCENGYVECDASGKPSAIICRLEQVDNTILKDELKVLIHSSQFAGNERQADIINQALKEIERLEDHNNKLMDKVEELVYECDCAKQEAREEFAERLKEKHQHNTTSIVSLVTVFDNIDNLLKEMRNK